MQPLRHHAILIIVTNPVDILTSIARSISGLPPHQVIGTGTFLDTLRLRLIIAERLQVRNVSMRMPWTLFLIRTTGRSDRGSRIRYWRAWRLSGGKCIHTSRAIGLLSLNMLSSGRVVCWNSWRCLPSDSSPLIARISRTYSIRDEGESG